MKEKCINKLKELTGHNNVKIVERGNFATFAALYIIKKTNPKAFILIPDQSGWISFKKYPKTLGFEAKPVKTNYGVIDLKDLQEKAGKAAALLLMNPAGYYAEQPMKQISEICKDKLPIILDVSGGLGDKELCNPEYADIMLGSFGKWKPVNAGYGGFISVKDIECFKKGKDIFSISSVYNSFYSILYRRLEKLPERLDFLYKKREKILKDLKDYQILHRDKKGINVIIKFSTEKEKQDILEYCKNNKYEWVECPRYIKVEEKAISIEVKRC